MTAAVVAAAEAVAMAMVVGEVEVAVMRDLLHEKGRKTAVVVMGLQKKASSTVVSLGISPGNAGPRRRRARTTWREDESSLMLVERGEVFELAPSTGAANSKLSLALVGVMGVIGLLVTSRGRVHLIEEKVFTQFNDEVKKEGRCWVLAMARRTT
jgi:hypothetical protein